MLEEIAFGFNIIKIAFNGTHDHVLSYCRSRKIENIFDCKE